MTDYPEVVQIARELIAIPSVNPLEAPCDASPYGEQDVAEFIKAWLEGQGIDVVLQEVGPRRANVVAVAGDVKKGKAQLLCAHMDTVNVKDMATPFDPVLRDGLLHGRGSCDDKGPLAAALVAFRDYALQAGPTGKPVVFLGSCGEEYNMAGGKHFLQNMPDGLEIGGAIFAEPTELKVINAHKGAIRVRLSTQGVSAHSSRPQLGQNAIYAMSRVILEVETFANVLSGNATCPEVKTVPQHPQLGTETLVCTIVNGGRQMNIIPNQCEAFLDWRILPGRSADGCLWELDDYLQGRLSVPVHSKLLAQCQYAAMETPVDAPMVQALLDAVKRAGQPRETDVAFYATDASAFVGLKIPMVVFGPGSIAQAHAAEEYISLMQLGSGVVAYGEFLKNL
ncbi:TPA: hypothetical protein DDW35_04525 [Candidatus Sumerlaeota bacterium]|jgi:acetylornithine deacetylase|nr:hypothetical protein [Candidatus Sumerlaeota bacterium]